MKPNIEHSVDIILICLIICGIILYHIPSKKAESIGGKMLIAAFGFILLRLTFFAIYGG